MPSTYTVNLGIEKPATGEQSGTWGDTTNTNFDILDQAINGAVRVTLTGAGTSGSPNQLQIIDGAASDGRNKWIEIYSASDLGGSAYVQLNPDDAEKILFIRNSLAGSQSVLLFQGTYDAARDLEVPAGVDMVVKFDGAGAASATVTDVYTKLQVTELTTPTLTASSLTATSLTATSADINGGTVDNSVIGGTTPAAITGTTITANTSLNIAGDGATVTGIKDEDDMASNSATKLATQQSIKAYVDSQVGTVDTWSEVLANGATSGTTNPEIDAGQFLKTDTINETTVGSGVTVDSVLLKDDVVNATDVEVSSISANDGTEAATIADVTGVMTIGSSVLTSTDINGGTIDGTTIGGTAPAVGTFSQVNVNGNVVSDGADLDGAVTINESGADVDFRVESAVSPNSLFLNGANGQVGLGNGGPQGTLHVNTTDAGTNVATKILATLPGTATQGFSRITLQGRQASVDYDNTIAGSYGLGLIYASPVKHNFSDGTNYTFGTSTADTVVNEDGIDHDFRVESATNTHALFVQGSDGAVGIGESAPQGNLHIKDGSGSGASPSATIDDLVVDCSSFGGITILTPNTAAGYLAFGDPDDGDHGQIFYAHSTDTMNVRTASGLRATIGLGLYMDGATGGDKGAGTINATALYSGRLEVSGTASTETVINEDGNDHDFRVESDTNTHALFVQGSDGRVGINTATPGGPLEVSVASGTSGPSSSFRVIAEDGGAWGVYPLTAVANPVWNTNVNSGETHAWSVGGTEYMRLDITGLDVTGDVNITGRIGATDAGYGTSGQVLSSTGTGTDWIDTASPEQVRDGEFTSIDSVGGTANAITGTCTPALTTWVTGQTFFLTAAAENTGPTTADFGPGAVAVELNGAALDGGEIKAGGAVALHYDGAALQLISGGNTLSNLNVDTFTGGVDYTAGTTTQLTLTGDPGTLANTQVYFDGVYQEKTEYSLAAAVITFTSAIPVGVASVEVVYGTIADVLASSIRQIQTGDGSTTVFTLSNAYEVGNGTLHVYINGVRQEPNYGYTETSTTQVTFDSAPALNDVILFLINPFVNRTTADAASVTYDNSGSGLTATNAQAAIDEIVDEFVPNTSATSYGFYTTRNATDIVNDVDISAGQCWDTTRTVFLQGSAMTKQLDANWAAGTNAGMLDTGTVSASEGYYIYAMISDVDGSVDYLASLQSTWSAVVSGGTNPTNYTKGQIIGFIYRNSGPELKEVVWSGNHCQYLDTGTQSFQDSSVAQQQFETYSINTAPANAVCNWQVFSDDASGTGDGKRIGVRYADGTADFVSASASYMAYFTQFGLSTVNVTRGTASFDFQINDSREIMMLSTEYATTTITAYIRGYWMPYRLEATS